MPAQESVPVSPPEKSSSKPKIIAGVVIAVIFVTTIGLVVKFKPEWLGGKALNQGPTTSVTGSHATPVAAVVKPTPIPSPTPVPTPNLGPGPWACDPLGICSRYNNTTVSSGCPKTFADTNCLNQCGNKAVQCSKF